MNNFVTKCFLGSILVLGAFAGCSKPAEDKKKGEEENVVTDMNIQPPSAEGPAEAADEK